MNSMHRNMKLVMTMILVIISYQPSVAQFSKYRSTKKSEVDKIDIKQNKKSNIFYNYTKTNNTFTESVSFKHFSFISETSFANSIFENNVDLQEAKFYDNVDFSGVLFKSKVFFKLAKFKKCLNLERAVFLKEADFKLVRFDSTALFLETRFNSNVCFSNCKFEDAWFVKTVFRDTTVFKHSVFKENARFSFAQFYSSPDFSKSKFEKYVTFNDSEFKNNVIFAKSIFSSASFEDTKFNNYGDFNESIINDADKISFKGTYLPDTLNFENANIIKGSLNFTTCNYTDKEHRINLLGVDIEKVKLRYLNFKVLFNDDTPFYQKKTVYNNLLSRMKDLGYLSSFEKLDIEYKELLYLHNGKVFTNFIQKYWWNYGYKKDLIIRNTIVLLLLFFFINVFITGYFTKYIYSIPELDKINVVNKNNFIRKIGKSIVYTATIFFSLKIEMSNFKFEKLFRLDFLRFFSLIYFFIMYIAGLICMGFIANLIIQ